MDRGKFESRFLPDGSGERVVTAAHDLADAVRAGEAGASGRLADLVLAVGPDRWPCFSAEAAQKIESNTAAAPKYRSPSGYEEAATGDKTFGLPKAFWQWYHRQEKVAGEADADRSTALDAYRLWLDLGKPGPDQR